jgi:hypothetical protein
LENLCSYIVIGDPQAKYRTCGHTLSCVVKLEQCSIKLGRITYRIQSELIENGEHVLPVASKGLYNIFIPT